MRWSKSIFAVALIGSVTGFAPRSWAFSIDPGFQIIWAKPGEKAKAVYQVINDRDEPMTVRCRLRDSFVNPDNKGMTADAWLKPSFTEITIPAHGKRTAAFAVQPPQGAKGELAALISFVPETKENPASTSEMAPKGGIKTRIVTLITVSLYLRVQGTEIGEADLGDLNVTNVPIRGTQPAHIEASVAVKNLGNVHQRPGGNFEIYRVGQSTPVYTLEFQPGWPVFPFSSYTFMASSPAGTLVPGDYQVLAHVQFVKNAAINKKVGFTVDSSSKTVNFHELP